MWKILLAGVLAATAARPAEACLNGTEWTTNDYVRVVVKAEKHLEAAQYGDAKRALGRMRFPNAALQGRADDVKMVIKLRGAKEAKDFEAVIARFKDRAENGKDVRFKAWVAEAKLGLGQKDEARAMLVALKESDLMPDAYAFLALAKLSAGTERFDLWKQCRTRAKNKEICELPAEVKTKT